MFYFVLFSSFSEKEKQPSGLGCRPKHLAILQNGLMTQLVWLCIPSIPKFFLGSRVAMLSVQIIFGIHLCFYVLVMSSFLLALRFRDAGYLTLHGKLGDETVPQLLFPDMDLNSKTQRTLLYVMLVCMLANWIGSFQAFNSTDLGFRGAMRSQCMLVHGLQPVLMLGNGHLKLREEGARSWTALHGTFAMLFLFAQEKQ